MMNSKDGFEKEDLPLRRQTTIFMLMNKSWMNQSLSEGALAFLPKNQPAPLSALTDQTNALCRRFVDSGWTAPGVRSRWWSILNRCRILEILLLSILLRFTDNILLPKNLYCSLMRWNQASLMYPPSLLWTNWLNSLRSQWLGVAYCMITPQNPLSTSSSWWVLCFMMNSPVDLVPHEIGIWVPCLCQDASHASVTKLGQTLPNEKMSTFTIKLSLLGHQADLTHWECIGSLSFWHYK